MCFLWVITFVFFSAFVLLLLALFVSKLTFDILYDLQACNTDSMDRRSVVPTPSPTQQTPTNLDTDLLSKWD